MNRQYIFNTLLCTVKYLLYKFKVFNLILLSIVQNVVENNSNVNYYIITTHIMRDDWNNVKVTIILSLVKIKNVVVRV